MRFSVHGLLIYVVVVSISLAVAQMPFLIGCGLLVLVIVVASFVLPVRTWRFLVYGGLIGIVSAMIGLVIYSELLIKGR